MYILFYYLISPAKYPERLLSIVINKRLIHRMSYVGVEVEVSSKSLIRLKNISNKCPMVLKGIYNCRNAS